RAPQTAGGRQGPSAGHPDRSAPCDVRTGNLRRRGGLGRPGFDLSPALAGSPASTPEDRTPLLPLRPSPAPGIRPRCRLRAAAGRTVGGGVPPAGRHLETSPGRIEGGLGPNGPLRGAVPRGGGHGVVGGRGGPHGGRPGGDRPPGPRSWWGPGR